MSRPTSPSDLPDDIKTELDALRVIVEALLPLDDETRRRILVYTGDRFTP